MDLADIRKKAGMSTGSEGTAIQGEEKAPLREDAVMETPAFEPYTTSFVDSLMPDDATTQSFETVSLSADDRFSDLEWSAAGETSEKDLLYEFPLVEEVNCKEEPPVRETAPSVAISSDLPVAVVDSEMDSSYNGEREDFLLPAGRSPLELLMAGRSELQDGELYGDVDSSVESAGEALLEYLCFRVSHELYAVSIMEIKEIIKLREWTEVPRAPHFIRGVISLRGVIIPVFDMRRRLGLPAIAASGKERIVVVKEREGFCGILVDEVVQVVRIPVTSIEPAPAVLEGIDREFVLGIGRHDSNMLILLSLENILDLELV